MLWKRCRGRRFCLDERWWMGLPSCPPPCDRFYERALQASPEDTSVMDALGELLLGVGEAERAFEVGGLGA